MDTIDRPAPLDAAASRTIKVVGTLSALVTALAGAGISLLSSEQVDALTALLGAVPGLVTMAGVALAAFGVVKRAKPEVTPVADPRDNAGNSLVPLGSR
jgi:uncharacterized protein with von Willebrand factor type A (vWA) domain